MDAGVVIQAYLKDARRDLAEMIAFSATRAKPLTVRLVKGAYWDTETVHAQAEGWPVPVFARKEETDASYERCVALLHDNHGKVRAAFGSHNLRSLGYAVAYARDKGIPDSGYEVQLLYGMAAPLHAAVRRMGLRLRVYAPVGELVPGMAYLVRRLLENTANESFVRRRFVEGRDLDELLAPPGVDDLPEPEPPVRRRPTDPSDPARYAPEPVAEWRRAEVRTAFAAAVEKVDRQAVKLRVPAIIDGKAVSTENVIASVDPADPDRTVAISASCSRDEAESALAAARRAWPAWRRTPARQRAAVLFRAADWMRARRHDLAALEVFEAGKPWADADADVCEAIDFCEYYGREMLRLDRGGVVESPPGERNRLTYEGRGIGVVIAPWNFPLAIPTGMVTAALVTGNAVLFKPAEQTPAVAAKLVDALVAGGLPPGVLAFLPGVGEDVGAYLVEHPDVSFVTFTGSKAVGLKIIETAARHRPGQRHVKRVVAEMGGKNAIVIDADADLDQAVPIAIASAFGYAGQKCSACSRLVVVDAVYDQVVERVAGAAAELRVGHPRDMATSVGPLIDADAYKRVREYVELAPDRGPGGARQVRRCAGQRLVRRADGGGRREAGEPAGHRGDLRAGAGGDAGVGLRRRHRRRQRHRVRAHRRGRVPLARPHPPSGRRATGRERLRQPGHHRCGRRPPPVRRARHVGRRVQGGRAGLSPAVPRAPSRQREHPPPRLRPCCRGRGGLFLASAGSCRAFVVDATGLEPATSCVSSRRSTGLSYASGLPASMIVRRPRPLRR